MKYDDFMSQPKRGLTRRQVAASAIALTPLAAQQAAKPPDDLAAAREQLQRGSGTLRKFKLPQLVEPSFVFKP